MVTPMVGSTDLIIETRGLSKSYGRFRALRELDLGVRAGEIFGFLGPNGAGKTTTIRLLLGLIRPSGGQIRLFGRATRLAQPNLLGDVGYLPGELGLYPDLTGRQMLDHFSNLRRITGSRQSNQHFRELAQRFPIDLERRIKGYSKGMKQIVGIMQAFMHSPPLLILDEPTSGLDPLMQDAFYDLLKVSRGQGQTIFFSSHNLAEVEKVCDRIAILKRGRLLTVEKIDDYRAKVGKQVLIRLGRQADHAVGVLGRLEGVNTLTQRQGYLTFNYTGSADGLVQALVRLKITDLNCQMPSLEDIFLQFYGDAQNDES